MQIGTVVTIISRRGLPRAFATVTRVTKRFIELSNGSRWSTNTLQTYPKATTWETEHIEERTEEHVRLRVVLRTRAKCLDALDKARAYMGLEKCEDVAAMDRVIATCTELAK